MKLPNPYLVNFITKEDMKKEFFKTSPCKEGDFYCFFTAEQFAEFKEAIQI